MSKRRIRDSRFSLNLVFKMVITSQNYHAVSHSKAFQLNSDAKMLSLSFLFLGASYYDLAPEDFFGSPGVVREANHSKYSVREFFDTAA